MRKTYLMPQFMRRGQQTLSFVVKEENSYWLGTYSELIGQNDKNKVYCGVGSEYAYGVTAVGNQ